MTELFAMQTRMILNIGNVVFASVFAVASIWGMNLADDHTDSRVVFDVVSMPDTMQTMLLSI